VTGTVLLTGATGYVGGRLARRLAERGVPVRCLARRPENLRGRVPSAVEVVPGDVLVEADVERALEGVRAAYYLVHSLGAEADFRARDRQAAELFGRVARRAGVTRIIYLGGLGHGDDLSPHLASRQEVGAALRAGGVPVVELRASIVLGSGSLSFELIRSLTERLPVMLVPRWAAQQAQPIAIADVLAYLDAALDLPIDSSEVVEIGGPDRLSYLDLMAEYARQRGLRRHFLRVPVLTPRLSSLWLGLVTPVYARVGRKLVDSLRNATVVTSDAAGRLFPQIVPIGSRQAIAAALAEDEQSLAGTRWCDALSATVAPRSWGGVQFGARLVDSRELRLAVPPAAAFAPIRRIGGATGWYAGDVLWRLRGFLDLLWGGPGLRRGRRSPDTLTVGDPLDFWRVEAVEEDRLLRLRAEMKLPGRAWLQFEVNPDDGGARVRQSAIFDPVGLSGLVYWYALWPLHQYVFAAMLRGIARAAARP
jgi:uncharacterized protein YbjT (DUF2867 family)